MVPWSLPTSVTSVLDLWLFGTDPDQDPYLQICTADLWIRIRILLRILLFSSVSFTKRNFFIHIFAYYFLKLHLHHCSKIKKSHKTLKIMDFLTIYLDDGRICTNNDGFEYRSRRFKNLQVLQIQIQFNSTVCNITRGFWKAFSYWSLSPDQKRFFDQNARRLTGLYQKLPNKTSFVDH